MTPHYSWLDFLRNRANMKVEVSSYDTNLKAKALVDWLGEMEHYFKYNKIKDL